MVPGDGEADLAVDFEAAGGGEEAERWRTERVGWGEDDAAVVGSAAVGCGGRTAQSEVPFEEIGFEGCGVQG